MYTTELANGVAAVIIAPGPPIARDEVGQNRAVADGDDPYDSTSKLPRYWYDEQKDPRNYLDTYESVLRITLFLIHGLNAFADGFIHGS